MSFLAWVSWSFLVLLYISMLFTVAIMTYKKGRTLLLILGFILPILWLVGAVLPAKPGSRYEVEAAMRYSREPDETAR